MSGIQLDVAMAMVVTLESEGRLEEAEALLRQVAEEMETADPQVLGSLHVDLGQLAEKRGNNDVAVREYERALEILRGQKGDAYLETAHVHFNLARILVGEEQAERRLEHAEEALRRYRSTPLATETDVIDGRLLVSVVQPGVSGEVDAAGSEELLADVMELPCEDLYAELVREFLVNYVLHRRLERLPLERFYRQAFAWAGGDLMTGVLKTVNEELPRFLYAQGLPRAPATVRRADVAGPYRERFTEEEWAGITLIPLNACAFVARNVDHRDQISAIVERLLSGEERAWHGPLHREIVRSVAGSEPMPVLKRAMGLSSEQLSSVRAILRDRLTADEYQELLGGVFLDQWNLAVETDGDLNEEIRRAVYAFAMFWSVDLTVLDTGHLLDPPWDARQWLLRNNEGLRLLEALEIGAELNERSEQGAADR